MASRTVATTRDDRHQQQRAHAAVLDHPLDRRVDDQDRDDRQEGDDQRSERDRAENAALLQNELRQEGKAKRQVLFVVAPLRPDEDRLTLPDLRQAKLVHRNGHAAAGERRLLDEDDVPGSNRLPSSERRRHPSSGAEPAPVDSRRMSCCHLRRTPFAHIPCSCSHCTSTAGDGTGTDGSSRNVDGSRSTPWYRAIASAPTSHV